MSNLKIQIKIEQKLFMELQTTEYFMRLIQRWFRTGALYPPPIVSKLPSIIDPSLNVAGQGGTIPRFLLDGSPVVHDTYFDHPTKSTGWYTLLMIPYGRAGAGFSMIDITDVSKPNHIYSILNDHDGQQILRVDHNRAVFKYSYRSSDLIKEIL